MYYVSYFISIFINKKENNFLKHYFVGESIFLNLLFLEITTKNYHNIKICVKTLKEQAKQYQ